MSHWEDSYDIGGDGIPDDFDSVADFDDGTAAGDATDVGAFDEDAALGDLVVPGDIADADAWVVDLDLGGLADVADIAVVAGVDDLGAIDPEAARAPTTGAPLFAAMLAHDLTDIPDGADPFASLIGRTLDDDELRNEIRHLRLTPPFAARTVEDAPLS